MLQPTLFFSEAPELRDCPPQKNECRGLAEKSKPIVRFVARWRPLAAVVNIPAVEEVNSDLFQTYTFCEVTSGTECNVIVT